MGMSPFNSKAGKKGQFLLPLPFVYPMDWLLPTYMGWTLCFTETLIQMSVLSRNTPTDMPRSSA